MRIVDIFAIRDGKPMGTTNLGVACQSDSHGIAYAVADCQNGGCSARFDSP